MKKQEKLVEGFKAAFNTKKKALTTITLSISFFVILALSTSIGYSIDMLGSGFKYWIPAVTYTIRGFYVNGGTTSITLNIIYSILVGTILTNTYTQFKSTGLKTENLSGIAPGVLVAGCAGCGVGMLSLIGLTGILAFLPFQGTLLKIGGMLLITYFIAKIGNPKICSIPS